MACSQEIYDYDFVHRQRILRKKQETPKDFDASAYVTRCVFARADDGESVPISLLHRRDLKLDGTRAAADLRLRRLRPCDGRRLLDQPPVAGRPRLRLRHRPCARRHGEGLALVRDGKLANKPNTFGDFIAAVRHLVAEGYGAPERVVAHGGSAGGMLMGAVANSRRELFAGIVADVPFVDVLNTMLDDTPAADAAGMARNGAIRSATAEAFADHPRLQPLRQRRGRRPIRRSWRWPA